MTLLRHNGVVAGRSLCEPLRPNQLLSSIFSLLMDLVQFGAVFGDSERRLQKILVLVVSSEADLWDP